MVSYLTGGEPLAVEMFLREIEDLHDRIELGPHWDTVEFIERTNGLAFRRDFHDDSWKVKLRTLLEAGHRSLGGGEGPHSPVHDSAGRPIKAPPDASATSMQGGGQGAARSAASPRASRCKPRIVRRPPFPSPSLAPSFLGGQPAVR